VQSIMSFHAVEWNERGFDALWNRPHRFLGANLAVCHTVPCVAYLYTTLLWRTCTLTWLCALCSSTYDNTITVQYLHETVSACLPGRAANHQVRMLRLVCSSFNCMFSSVWHLWAPDLARTGATPVFHSVCCMNSKQCNLVQFSAI
jgi:hypothetical protein